MPVIEKLRGLRLTTAAQLVEGAVEETLAYYAFPEEHWRRIPTTDEIDKRFFVRDRAGRHRSILLFGHATRHSSVPAADFAAAARRGGQGWPHLRPPQGLALTGPSTAARWRGTGLHSRATGTYRQRRLWLSGAGDLVAKRGASAGSVTGASFVLPS